MEGEREGDERGEGRENTLGAVVTMAPPAAIVLPRPPAATVSPAGGDGRPAPAAMPVPAGAAPPADAAGPAVVPFLAAAPPVALAPHQAATVSPEDPDAAVPSRRWSAAAAAGADGRPAPPAARNASSR